MNKETIEMVTKFLEDFNVEAHSMCAQNLTFNPERGSFRLQGTDVYGDTAIVSVSSRFENETILEISHSYEEELTVELSEAYHELNYDKKRFIRFIQKKYENENQI